MPHFVIECSKDVIELESSEKIVKEVYNAAEDSGLFEKGDIKVRIKSFDSYLVGGSYDNFIHVFSNIMEGRTIQQKKELSKAIVKCLNNILPSVPIISMNIRDFEKATYCNKSMI